MQTTFTPRPLNASAFEIARLIHGYLTKKQIGHSLISQRFMLDKLEKWYGHKISRAALCYNLKNLVDDGLLKRVTRHRRNPETGQFEPRVTLFAMTLKLRALFNRLASYFRGIGWHSLIDKVKERRAAIRREAEETLPVGAPRNRQECNAYLRGLGLFGAT